MTVENSIATCTACDWNENALEADVHADQHYNATGHRVQVAIYAHIGT